MIYDKTYECISRDDLEQLQMERLQTTMNRIYQNVAYYKHSFDKNKINIEKIKSIKDLQELPFTTKDDLRLGYPYELFAVPLRDIVRIHSTAGTTGKPIVVGYTHSDINHWMTMICRLLTAVDITDHDFIQIAFNYNLSSAGLGFHYGAEKIGASVIPSSSEIINRQITVMKDFKSTVLISTPGFALHIAKVLEEMNIHPEELYLKAGLFGAEPWSENLRSEIERGLHLKAYDNYGLTELIGPGVAFECTCRSGLHINEDHFIVEVVDPKTLMPLPIGDEGELVFTTITKQGFPLIRYRTGDISALVEGKCECGRTLTRMKRIQGRTDDMIIIGGINFFPSQVEEALLQVKGVEPHFQIILNRADGIDTVEVQVEASGNMPSFDEMSTLVALKSKVERHLEDAIGVKSKVTFVERKSIRRSQGDKLKRVIDKREK